MITAFAATAAFAYLGSQSKQSRLGGLRLWALPRPGPGDRAANPIPQWINQFGGAAQPSLFYADALPRLNETELTERGIRRPHPYD